MVDQAARWDGWAEEYDAFHGDMDADQVVAFLADRAPGKRVLDLGAGTGRIAIPMARAGYDLTCLDLSAGMCRALKTKRPRTGARSRWSRAT